MTTTIYFSGSITGGREDVELYQTIVAALEADGYRVLAGAVASGSVCAGGEEGNREKIFARDLGWLDKADLVVAEVSKPSHGVGYEIAYACHQREIPVICLFRPVHTKRCSVMIAGNPGLRFVEYADLPSLLPILRESVREAGRSIASLP